MRWNYVGSVDYEKKEKEKKTLIQWEFYNTGLLLRAMPLLRFFFWSRANVTDVQGADVSGADSRTRCLIIELMRPRNNFAD